MRAGPAYLFALTVVLDPGHGGIDTGALHKTNHGIFREKDITMALARETAAVLRERGARVVLTREGDRSVSLDRRAEIANRAMDPKDQTAFVSIHVNSSGEGVSSGAETYVFNGTTNEASERLADLENGKSRAQPHGTLDLIISDLATTASYGDSVRLACQVQRSVSSPVHTHGRDRGVRQALFYVLMRARMPSVLFEPGFLSNSRDLARLTSPKDRKSIARELAEGILAWGHQPARGLSAVAKPPCRIH
jgi:N-acetylmuramoyl-L-alanine amidase